MNDVSKSRLVAPRLPSLKFLIGRKSMDELHVLIRQQASYSDLVDWIREKEDCQYLTACAKLNAELKRYRLQHLAS
ncbi:MAG: hypothetical protein AAF773_23480 [Cyanobacteria bacterium P01_D01_bin.115]